MLLFFFLFDCVISTMNVIKNIPKKLFKYKKSSQSISRSENLSFGSTTTSFSSNYGLSTPTSVLPTLSNAEVYSELLQAFHLIGGDGGAQKEELEAVIDGDGNIWKEELEAILNRVETEPPSEEELKNAFDFFDSDHDGKITAEELFSVFKTIGDGNCTLEDCRRMIRGVDKNDDGFVCFEDFSLMMEQQRIEN